MLNVELSAKPMLNCPILNWEFRIQEATTELKTQNSKFKKLKIQIMAINLKARETLQNVGDYKGKYR